MQTNLIIACLSYLSGASHFNDTRLPCFLALSAVLPFASCTPAACSILPQCTCVQYSVMCASVLPIRASALRLSQSSADEAWQLPIALLSSCQWPHTGLHHKLAHRMHREERQMPHRPCSVQAETCIRPLRIIRAILSMLTPSPACTSIRYIASSLVVLRHRLRTCMLESLYYLISSPAS